MGYPDEFTGFMIKDTKKWTEFTKETFKPKKFEDYDIDIEIECCGICGSDVHTITGGWGEVPLPVCVGHEVVGKAVKVGPKVTQVKEGDRVGVGAQIWSCLECEQCKNDNENYCPKQVDTYAAPYPHLKDTISQGGYASHIRAHEYFTFPIPDGLDSKNVAPMMCAGLTTYSPLVRNGCGPGKKVAIVGLGGLGHYAVLWAIALGAEVTVLSHSANKKADALKMGAKEFVITGEKDWAKPYAFKFDIVLCTADASHKFNMEEYLSVLKVGGHFANVGLPNDPISLNLFAFTPNGSSIGGTHIGCRKEALAMLKLAADKGIKSWIQEIPLGEEGLKKGVEGVANNDVRYRYVLTDYKKIFA